MIARVEVLRTGMLVSPRDKYQYEGNPSKLRCITERYPDGRRRGIISPSIQGRIVWEMRDLVESKD